MKVKIKLIERLGLDVPTQQQQPMRFLKSLDLTKNGDIISNLKNQALQNPDTTHPVDLISTCDLATYWSSKSKILMRSLSQISDQPLHIQNCNDIIVSITILFYL